MTEFDFETWKNIHNNFKKLLIPIIMVISILFLFFLKPAFECRVRRLKRMYKPKNFFKIIPTEKEKIFILYNKIFITYGVLTNFTDEELLTCIYHDLGHRKQLGLISLLITFNFFLIIFFMLLLPKFYLPLLLLSYLLFCYICRWGEYHADIYALKMTSYDSVKSFIQHRINHENKLSNYFYLFRYHPSHTKRVKNLHKSIGKPH